MTRTRGRGQLAGRADKQRHAWHMLGFFGRHWRGDARFWISTLLVSALLTWVVIFGAMLTLSSFTITHTPSANIAAAILTGVIVASVAIWQTVGTWRASAKGRAPGRWFITRWTARAIALAGLALAAFCVATMPGGIARYYAEANDADVIGQQPHEVSVDGDRVIVTGHMSWGLLSAFADTVRDNAELRTVVLNSPGGHYGVGYQMAALIKSRGLDTLTTDMCGSACTYAFLAGNNRYLQKGARLAYHAPFGNTSGVIANVTQHATEVLRGANVPEDFIAHVFATPGDKAWFPTVRELRQANIVTDVVE